MTPAPSPESRPFFGRVESLRGLGTLAVAGCHFAGYPVNGVPLLPAARWPDADALQNAIRWLGHVALVGHAAVMAFFVISGFVLRLSLEHGPKRPVPAAARFLLARLFRVYPVVVFSVLIYVLLAELRLTPPVSGVLRNMLLLDTSITLVLWALQVELLAAPVIVALYFLERRFGPRALVPVALAMSGLAFKPSWTGFPFLSINLFAFVLGMLVPTLGRRLVAGLSRRAAAAWVCVAAAGLVLPGPCFGRLSRFSTLTEAYAAFALVGLVAYRPDVRALRWLDLKPLRLLGLASGSYYVLHMATVPVALPLAAALVPAGWTAAAPAAVGAAVVSAWLVAIAPLMVASYYLIEAPGIALGRRVARLLRLGAKPAPALVVAPAGPPVRRAA